MSKNGDEENGERRKGISFKLPWGGIELRGYDVVTVLLCCGLGAFGYKQYDMDVRAQTHYEETKKSHQDHQEALQEMIYVLTLSVDQREKLNLQMPNSLKVRIVKQEKERRRLERE